jgi:class 3 adenylate cyclase
MASPSRKLALLFADVSGSTTLYEKLGDRAALDAVESVVALLRRSVAAHRGHVVKTIGDEVMACFPDADAAMQAASDMQTRVAALPPFGATRLGIRVGFHHGAVIEENGDYFGDAVNTAARMAGLAKSGQIITTAATVAALSPLLRQGTRELAALSVKGKQSEVVVCEVLWESGDEVTMVASKGAVRVVETVLRLRHGGREILVDAAQPTVQMGRDAGHPIVIADRMASRLHGRIERRGDRFYCIDVSTNGTYVAIEGDEETVLRRDQAMLRGRGRLAFGHSTADPDAEVVEFEIETRTGKESA